MKRLFAALVASAAFAACGGGTQPDVCDFGERSFTIFDGDTGHVWEWDERWGTVRVSALDDPSDGSGAHSLAEYGRPGGGAFTCVEAREFVYGLVRVVREDVGI